MSLHDNNLCDQMKEIVCGDRIIIKEQRQHCFGQPSQKSWQKEFSAIYSLGKEDNGVCQAQMVA